VRDGRLHQWPLEEPHALVGDTVKAESQTLKVSITGSSMCTEEMTILHDRVRT